MVRVAKTKESDTLAYALNPVAGTVLTATAGGQAEAEFDFYNDSPDVAAFYLEVEGLPEDWVSGIGQAFEAYAAASGGGQLRLTLTPSLMAALGEYDFKTRIVSGGLAVGNDIPLVLRVDPALPGAVEAAVPEINVVSAPPPETNGTSASHQSPPVVDTPQVIEAAAPDVVAWEEPVALDPEPTPVAQTPPVMAGPEPDPIITPPVQAAPSPVERAPLIEQPIKPPTETPRAVKAPVEPPRTVQQPPVQQTPVTPTPVPQTPTPPPVQPPTAQPKTVSQSQTQVNPTVQQPPAQAKPAVQQAPVQPTPRPPTPTPAPTRAATPPPPPPEEPVLVDYNPRATGAAIAYEDEEQEKEITEPFLIDPKDGTVVSLRPGERMLLRFPFTNQGAREQTYILDEDRALDDGWLTLVQDQVNLTRNGTGELSLRITPPADAEPGDYPFTVTLGPQGGTLTSRALTVSVLATPAVELKTKETTVKVGPFANAIEFPLSVESAGNADTAFRISVKSPQSETPAEGAPVGSDTIYEVPQWRYLFDKEMESLRTTGSGREPRPVPITLRVRPKGAWWFGFKQTHRLRVVAVPVTEADNCGKPGNSLELTAVRSRFLPFPALLLIPIVLLIMLFFSGSANDLSVTNAQYTQVNVEGESNGNAYWIVAPKNSNTKQATLAWEARPLAILRLTGSPEDKPNDLEINRSVFGSGQATDQRTIPSGVRLLTYHYRISRFAGGGDRDAVVHYVFSSPNTPTLLTNAVNHQPLGGKEVRLSVPASGYARLDMTNMARDFYRLDWWLAKPLNETSPFKFKFIKGQGSIEPKATEHFLIQRNPKGDETATDDTFVLVTTDASQPVITVHLKEAP